MTTALIILSILAGIILLGCIFIAIVVSYIDKMHKELEDLTDLEKEDEDDKRIN